MRLMTAWGQHGAWGIRQDRARFYKFPIGRVLNGGEQRAKVGYLDLDILAGSFGPNLNLLTIYSLRLVRIPIPCSDKRKKA